jgi:hypothetical protein
MQITNFQEFVQMEPQTMESVSCTWKKKKNKYIEIIHSINVLSVLAQLPLATPLHVGGLFASKRIPNAQFPSLRGAAVATWWNLHHFLDPIHFPSTPGSWRYIRGSAAVRLNR